MGHDLYNNLLESGLSKHVSKPTRSDNILGLIFSTIVSFNINLEFYKGNFEKCRKILADTNWGVVENETDVNKSWEKIL